MISSINQSEENKNTAGTAAQIIFGLMIWMAFFFFVFAFNQVEAAVSLEKLPDGGARGDFVVGPGKMEMLLEPGQSRTIEMTVSNRLGTDKTFTLVEEDMRGSQNPGETVVLLGDDRGPYSLKDYVSVATTSIFIPDGYRARIPITVSIPAGAEPGGLYGSIVASTATRGDSVENPDAAVTTNAIITRIGTLFFVRVKGEADESGRLEGFSLTGGRKIFWSPQAVRFDLLYRNDGNVSVNPYGTITVKNLIGSSVGTLEVDPWFAMPDSLRFRQVEWKAPFLFGRYSAQASIKRGYGNETDVMDTAFWVIPWKVITMTLVGLVVVITGFKWLFRNFTFKRKDRV